MIYGIAVPIWIFIASFTGHWLTSRAMDFRSKSLGFAVGYTVIVVWFLGGAFVAFWLCVKAGGGQ
jgi:hypothetical protein